MAERTVEEIRSEIEAERQGLIDDVAGLQSQIRSLALLVAAALAIIALVTWRKGTRKGIAALWTLLR